MLTRLACLTVRVLEVVADVWDPAGDLGLHEPRGRCRQDRSPSARLEYGAPYR